MGRFRHRLAAGKPPGGRFGAPVNLGSGFDPVVDIDARGNAMAAWTRLHGDFIPNATLFVHAARAPLVASSPPVSTSLQQARIARSTSAAIPKCGWQLAWTGRRSRPGKPMRPPGPTVRRFVRASSAIHRAGQRLRAWRRGSSHRFGRLCTGSPHVPAERDGADRERQRGQDSDDAVRGDEGCRDGRQEDRHPARDGPRSPERDGQDDRPSATRIAPASRGP
jgi:hypothetical protein